MIDSLLVVRDFVFNEKRYTVETFLEMLSNNDEAFLKECREHPVCHGIDHPDANALANRLTTDLFSYFDSGIQMQITCIDPKILMEAYENPELHKNLVIRVGGYSDHLA